MLPFSGLCHTQQSGPEFLVLDDPPAQASLRRGSVRRSSLSAALLFGTATKHKRVATICYGRNPLLRATFRAARSEDRRQQAPKARSDPAKPAAMAAGEGTVWSDLDTDTEVPPSVVRTSSVAGLIMRRRSTLSPSANSATGPGAVTRAGGGAVVGTSAGAGAVELVPARRGLSRRVKGQEERDRQGRQGIAGDSDGTGQWWRRNAPREKEKDKEKGRDKSRDRDKDKDGVPKASLLRDFFRSALYTRKTYHQQPWGDSSLEPAQHTGISGGNRSPAGEAPIAAGGVGEKGGVGRSAAAAAASERGGGGGGRGGRAGLASRAGTKSSRAKAAGIRVWLRLGASGDMQVSPPASLSPAPVRTPAAGVFLRCCSLLAVDVSTCQSEQGRRPLLLFDVLVSPLLGPADARGGPEHHPPALFRFGSGSAHCGPQALLPFHHPGQGQGHCGQPAAYEGGCVHGLVSAGNAVTVKNAGTALRVKLDVSGSVSVFVDLREVQR